MWERWRGLSSERDCVWVCYVWCGGLRVKNLMRADIHFAFQKPVRESIRGPSPCPSTLARIIFPSVPHFQLWLFPFPTPPRSLPPSQHLSLFLLLATYHPYFIQFPHRGPESPPNFLSLSQKLYPLSLPHPPYSLPHSFPRALVLSLYPNRNAQCGTLAARAPADHLFLPHQTL